MLAGGKWKSGHWTIAIFQNGVPYGQPTDYIYSGLSDNIKGDSLPCVPGDDWTLNVIVANGTGAVKYFHVDTCELEEQKEKDKQKKNNGKGSILPGPCTQWPGLDNPWLRPFPNPSF